MSVSQRDSDQNDCLLFTADVVLPSVRTSTVVLNNTLAWAAQEVGVSAPDLRNRFINSMNRSFHNVTVSYGQGL